MYQDICRGLCLFLFALFNVDSVEVLSEFIGFIWGINSSSLAKNGRHIEGDIFQMHFQEWKMLYFD